jgi:hypothetical protein
MDDSLGYKGPSDVEYELDYFIDKAAIDFAKSAKVPYRGCLGLILGIYHP